MKTNNVQEVLAWENSTSAELYIAEDIYYKNSELFLTNFPDIKKRVEESLSFDAKSLKYSVSKTNNIDINLKRISAGSLNKTLKNNFKSIPEAKFEVEYRDGYFYDSNKTGGFDFALYDEKHNLINFRNYCLGMRSIHEGDVIWQSEIEKRHDWSSLTSLYNLPDLNRIGIDIPAPKTSPTIIGEFQFGNWALAYYDLFKVLHLDNRTDLDLLIYITATGDLEKSLSSNIVSYSKMNKTIQKYNSVLKVPIWLIGIDIKNVK